MSVTAPYESAGISLKRVGVRWVGPCPFHKETKPSFVVYPDGSFHCFGCYAHGTLKDFQEARGLSYQAIPDLNYTKDPLVRHYFNIKNELEAQLRLLLEEKPQKIRFSTYDQFDALLIDGWEVVQKSEVSLIDLVNYMFVKFNRIARGVDN